MPGISSDSRQRAYAHGVETLNSGFINNSGKGSRNLVGLTSSPRPLQTAADWKMKNGTSDPIISAIFVSDSRGKFVSNSSFSINRVEAASLLPPPKQAPCGILFLSTIEVTLVMLVSLKYNYAART